jgi:hypothetical protein
MPRRLIFLARFPFVARQRRFPENVIPALENAALLIQPKISG